ncbi:MAG: ABC transporter ATP-binding protein [Acetobacteraceae bacterium]|nr:ABC transporter ATP-binding protein [Pseudomonadota bacterium]
MLEVKDLVVSYGAVEAVRGVTLTAVPGAITAIVGANGAGKSSLLRAITGLAPVRAGQVLLDGQDVTRVPASKRAGLGLAHAMEGRRIFRHLSVEENLRLAWQFGRRRNQWGEALDRVFLTFPILKEKRRSQAGLLSGGQQQMLIVSAATICEPSYLLLDEPSLGLAPIVVREIYHFFTDRCRENGTTVLLAEQMAAMALNVSAHGYVLRQGQVVREGPSAELVNSGLIAALSSAYL